MRTPEGKNAHRVVSSGETEEAEERKVKLKRIEPDTIVDTIESGHYVLHSRYLLYADARGILQHDFHCSLNFLLVLHSFGRASVVAYRAADGMPPQMHTSLSGWREL